MKIFRQESRKKVLRESNPADIIRHRFSLLGYDDYGDDSDSGGGSVATGILAAATSLGSAYLVSQQQPLTTQSPTNVRPNYPTGTGGSSMLLIVGVIVLAVVAFIAFGNK